MTDDPQNPTPDTPGTPDAARPPKPRGAAQRTPGVAPTQRQRWLMYGSNTAVFVVAAIAIAVFVNWLGVRQLSDKGDWTRFDLTATRRYSLSPQTRQVLRTLERPVNVVLLYSEGTIDAANLDRLGRIEDLLDEYQSRSDHITVRQIDPTADPDELDALTQDLLGRFESSLGPSREALEGAIATLESLRTFAETQPNVLADTLLAVQEDRDLVAFLQTLSGLWRQLTEQVDTSIKDLKDGLADPLPNHSDLRRVAIRNIEAISSGLLNGAIQTFDTRANQVQSQEAGKALIARLREYEKMRDAAAQAVEKLRAVRFSGYDELRQKILASNAVVIYTDAPESADAPAPAEPAVDERRSTAEEGVVALTLREVYPVRARQTERGVEQDLSFEGEEALTGAVLNLTLDHVTRVVFVNPGVRPVLEGQPSQTTYRAVAEQLRQMRFTVEEWQPFQGLGRDGRPAPPPPVPAAEPGETLILVAVPPMPTTNPNMSAAPGLQMARSVIAEHLAKGGRTLVLSAPTPPSSGAPNQPDLSLAPALAPFGLMLDEDDIVLTAVADPGRPGSTVVDSRMLIESWPADHPVAAAMPGLNSYISQAHPIGLPASAPEGVELWSVGESPDDTWAEPTATVDADAKRDEDEPEGPFSIAAAAQKGEQRVFVIADQFMVTDARTLSRFGSGALAYPGNRELFVNAVYWLAGQDALVAPGARSQEVRRIAAISDGAKTAVWWSVIVAMPVACLFAGLVVWTVRRR